MFQFRHYFQWRKDQGRSHLSFYMIITLLTKEFRFIKAIAYTFSVFHNKQLQLRTDCLKNKFAGPQCSTGIFLTIDKNFTFKQKNNNVLFTLLSRLVKPSRMRSMNNRICHCLGTFQTVHRDSTSGEAGHNDILFICLCFPQKYNNIFTHKALYKKFLKKRYKNFLEEFIRWLYYIYKNNYPIVAEPVPSLQSATEALTEICSLNVKVTVYATPAPSKCSATEFKVTVTLS